MRNCSQLDLDDLIDGATVLNHWVDAFDVALSRQDLSVSDAHIESFVDTDEQHLVNEEYEGYMGNYGETLDYWYRRAAIVVQSPLGEQINRFETDFDAALADAVGLARQGLVQELLSRVQRALPMLTSAIHRHGQAMWSQYSELACALPDADLAKRLCCGFEWSDFSVDDAPGMQRLAERFGAHWMQALVQAWVEQQPPWRADLASAFCQGRYRWPKSIAGCVAALQSLQTPTEVVEQLLAACTAELQRADKALAPQPALQRHSALAVRLSNVCELLCAFESCADSATRQSAVLRHVADTPSLYPPHELGAFLHAVPAAAKRLEAAQKLRQSVLGELRTLLAEAPLADDDFSMPRVEWICHCSDCTPVIGWARQPAPLPLSLAIAESRRNHVQKQHQLAASGIASETLKVGSPYKLVMTKPRDLPQKRRSARLDWTQALTLLANAKSEFAPL